jgi:protein-ribulosamine 3-kinase
MFEMAPSTDPSIWNQEIAVPETVISFVDEAVQESMYMRGNMQVAMSRHGHRLIMLATELPRGSQILGIEPAGSSYWARTARIDTIDGNGIRTSYFIKASTIEE